MIPHNSLNFTEKDRKNILEPLEKGYIAEGQKTRELENYLETFLDKKYCSAVSSGYMAIVLALKGLEIGKGTEVLIPSYTCSALWHAVKLIGAIPVLADIENKTYNLDPEDLDTKISDKTSAIIYPHMFGQPGYINKIKNRYDLPVIEDIAQSIGSKIQNQRAGTIGDITICSFYATKMIGAGEGGAVLTDSKSIAEKIQDIKSYDEKETLKLRFNAKISDITSGLALSRIKDIESNIEERRKIFQKYQNNFGKLIRIPAQTEPFQSNYYRCIGSHPEYTADEMINKAKNASIQLRKPVYKPLHLYNNYDLTLPITNKAWQKHFSIPLYPSLSKKQINKIIKFMRKQ